MGRALRGHSGSPTDREKERRHKMGQFILDTQTVRQSHETIP